MDVGSPRFVSVCRLTIARNVGWWTSQRCQNDARPFSTLNVNNQCKIKLHNIQTIQDLLYGTGNSVLSCCSTFSLSASCVSSLRVSCPEPLFA
eukprot:3603659-Amphidinium_carterae.1